jgi:hypothetical protein
MGSYPLQQSQLLAECFLPVPTDFANEDQSAKAKLDHVETYLIELSYSGRTPMECQLI